MARDRKTWQEENQQHAATLILLTYLLADPVHGPCPVPCIGTVRGTLARPGRVESRTHRSHVAAGGVEAVVEQVVDLAEELLARGGVGREDLVS